jgi:CRISPR locus-related DNA-binding protein
MYLYNLCTSHYITLFTTIRLIRSTLQSILAMSVNLRVHIAPVGFEFKRVTEALVRMQADKVYLVTLEKGDNAQEYLDKIRAELGRNYSHIRVEEVQAQIWDYFDCVEKFRSIINKEAGNHVYINVSTGTKVTAMAGMLSCMLWNATPYYVRITYVKSSRQTLPTEKIEDIIALPVYGINKPKPEYLTILGLLSSSGGKMKKAKIISELENIGIIKQKDETIKEFSDSAKHSQLRAILDPMEYDWKYVEVEASGRRSEVSITEQGRNALRIFGLPRFDFK